MTRFLRFYPLLLVFLVLSVQACDDDDPVIENEEEAITRVTYTLTQRDGSNDIVTFSFVDPDGDGGEEPMIFQSGALVAGAVYDGLLSFANEEELLDPELQEEDEDHQVFYQVSDDLDVEVAYAGLASDTDANGRPLGLRTVVTAGAPGSGELTITLRHEPNKAGATISNPAAAGGSTDVELVFPVEIE